MLSEHGLVIRTDRWEFPMLPSSERSKVRLDIEETDEDFVVLRALIWR